jgi:hypothetical protein
VEVTYYEGADHTFYRAEDRRRAVLRVAEWASKTFLTDAPSTQRSGAPASVSGAPTSAVGTNGE